MVRLINIYQIFSSTLLLFMFVMRIPNLYNEGLTFDTILILFTLILFSASLIYTNWYLLTDKMKWRIKFLKFNQYINLFQVFTLSLFGFTYDFVFGPKIMPYLSYGSTIDVMFFADFFNTRLSIFYKPSTVILIGVNFIPLVLYILLSNEFKKYPKSK